MRIARPFMTIALAAIAATTQGCATTGEAGMTADAGPATNSGPALWRVADDDTTIYLFGTVHALPGGMNWLSGPISSALAASQTLVTEISSGAMADPANQAKFQTVAMLPEGQTLRGQLTDEQKATYEAALKSLGMPVNAFDRVKPWFAAVTLGVLPLMKNGYAMENGVESALESAASDDIEHDALETIDDQIAAFDGLPMETQISYLVSVCEQIDDVIPVMDETVAKWSRGDADGLAKVINEEVDDPDLAKALLYDRNSRWADWIDDRLDRPGTVFIAVGAGHLAGKGSVQEYLAKDGITVTRVQ